MTYQTPEQQARLNIDDLLIKCGWVIQNRNELNLGAGIGVAIREFPTNEGPADYALFVNRTAVGVIEAKPEGTTLSGVSEQTEKYIRNFAADIPHVELPLPFAYESTGIETNFRDMRDPHPRSRRVTAFHQPELLQKWLDEGNTLRTRLQQIPTLELSTLRDCQFEAITGLETSLNEAKPRALIQMATGSGKTYMSVSSVYRLIKFAKAHRVLFLVDRRTLGRQTRGEFTNFITPDDGRKFSELYNVQLLSSPNIDHDCKATITTIQRLFSMLKGREFDTENEEQSLGDFDTGEMKSVDYNPDIPIETFDFIIVDECHRSIYNQWRQVLEYFDAFLIGLTATPSKQTFGFFNQNLVMEYTHERAVADRVNVPFEIFRIKTEITEGGSAVEANHFVDKRDKATREVKWEKLDEDLNYSENELDRSVVSPSQIRTVIRTFKERLYTDIFPGREDVPKTLVFAKDDSHAEDITTIIREEFGKGNEFCKKITYKTTGEKPEDLITSFRNSYFPRIAVSVDMVSTGTDIRPLECLLFMRDVKSRVYFEQMKGRGTRTIDSSDLQAVTRDATDKTHFVLVDAVGITESDKNDSHPLERKKTISFDKLVNGIALGKRDEDTLLTVAGRLAKLNVQINDEQRSELEEAAQGKTLSEIMNGLMDAADADSQVAKAVEMTGNESPTEVEIIQATTELTTNACAVFDDPKFRETLITIRKQQYQTIDTVSQDALISAEFETGQAEETVQSFKQFMEENKDELLALQIIYNQPYDKRHLTFDMIKKLANSMKKPPYNLNTERVWLAFEQLDKDRVKQRSADLPAGKAGKLLTDVISLVRYGLEQNERLIPFHLTVNDRFKHWLKNQQKAGNEYSPEQLEWLTMIKDHIASSMEITVDDLSYVPFNAHGGAGKAYAVFGDRFSTIMTELNEVLAA